MTTHDRPTVSVVVPVKDDARPLERCLASLARQTVAPFEVLVVDNGSSDDSAETAANRGATVLHQDIPGIAAASRTGYDRARGDVIARIDADTRLPADWVETLVDAFSSDPEVDVVTGRSIFTDGPRRARRIAALLYLGAYYALAGLALTHVPVFGSNFAMRREAWEQVRDEVHDSDRLHDDFDLSYHLGRRYRIRLLPQLRSGISMRPLIGGGGALRVRRGFSTVVVHWPHDLPWLRLARRIALRRRQRLSALSRTAGRTGLSWSRWR